MKGINIDISNPDNFVWKGSIAHDFDKESSTRLTLLRKDMHTALSRRHRKDYSKIKLINLKDHLEFIANQNLLQLDLYIAALKHDSRSLSTKNIGIAASIDDAVANITTSQEHFQAAVKTQKEELQNEEKIKSQEMQKEFNKIKDKATEQSNKAKLLEKKANELRVKANNQTILINNYDRYNEWIRLNNEFLDLQKKRRNLENSLRKSMHQSTTENLDSFYNGDDQ